MRHLKDALTALAILAIAWIFAVFLLSL